eukprot:4004788-Prymnesium_polylepis.1
MAAAPTQGCAARGPASCRPLPATNRENGSSASPGTSGLSAGRRRWAKVSTPARVGRRQRAPERVVTTGSHVARRLSQVRQSHQPAGRQS